MRRLTVTAMGAKGDGIATGEAGSLHVAGVLPGEIIELDALGSVISILTPSPDRVAPFCRHAGRCGGCKFQHWAGPAYREWKHALVVAALARVGLSPEVAPLIPATGDGRRRAVLHARFGRGKPELGFMAARSHDIVDLDTCPVLVPALRDAPDLARALIRPLAGLGKPVDVQVTATLAGLDVDLRGIGRVEPALRLTLAGLADRYDLARLSIHVDVVVERRAPLHRMGTALVNAPPGGFLQATVAGEEALAGLVQNGLGKARRIVDLFCGAGPFALRLAAERPVAAFDSDKPAVAAFLKAARATPGLKPVTGEARDLFRRPLLAAELAGFDAAVLDPPRAGAEAQVRQLAASRLSCLAYVSCDAGTFARDAAILVAGGWHLDRVTPVDQFAHSAHVELVGCFSRSR